MRKHGASILLLKLLFEENGLFKTIPDAKKERIDKQYYVTSEKEDITKDISGELLEDAENFVLKMKLVVKKLNNESISKIRENLGIIVG